jgi:hypothetical protein
MPVPSPAERRNRVPVPASERPPLPAITPVPRACFGTLGTRGR